MTVLDRINRDPTNFRNQCRGEPCVRPPNKNRYQTYVGANLVFARRTKTDIKPMFDNELETFASDIGSQTIFVRRANIRFAPTLVSDIGWISITTIYPKIYDRLLNPRRSRLCRNFALMDFYS